MDTVTPCYSTQFSQYYYYRIYSELESEALAYSKVGNMASRGGKIGEF